MASTEIPESAMHFRRRLSYLKRSAILDMHVPVDVVVGDSGRIGLNDLESLSFINIAALASSSERRSIGWTS